MTDRFVSFCDGFVLKWECSWPDDKSGQLSNDPDDPGGLTRWGIDQRSHPGVDIRNLTHDQALAIYWREWTAEAIEGFAAKLGEAFYDACVNCGLSRARQFLAAGGSTASAFIDTREAFYRRLAHRPSLSKYLDGWLNRTRDLRRYLA